MSAKTKKEHHYLLCSICLEEFDDEKHQPKLLSCHHSFCRACLTNLQDTGKGKIECRTCGKVDILLCAVDDLQTDFNVSNYMELLSTKSQSTAPAVGGCKLHSNQPLSFFCKKCHILICRDCIVINHPQASGHIIKEVSKATDEYKVILKHRLLEIERMMHHMVSIQKYIQVTRDQIQQSYQKAVADINDEFQQYQQLISERQHMVLDHLNQLQTHFVEDMNPKKEQVNKHVDQLKKIQLQLNNALCTGSLQDLQRVTKESNIEDVSKSVEVNLGMDSCSFQVLAHDQVEAPLQSALDQMGQVLTVSTGSAVAGRETLMYLQASRAKEALRKDDFEVTVQDPHGKPLECTLKSFVKGTAKFSFRPKLPGINTFLIKDKTHTKSKPIRINFDVRSNNPVFKFGFKDRDNGCFDDPQAVCVDSDGNIYVTDLGNDCLQKYNKDGEFTTQWTPKHSSPCEGSTPSFLGLCLDSKKSKVICPQIVTDNKGKPSSNAIQIFTLDGQPREQFSNTAMSAGLYVTVNSQNQIIVSDSEKHTLFVYNEQGALANEFGGFGDSPGKFNTPLFICSGQNDDIIVSDNKNHRVQVLNKDGKFLRFIGQSGEAMGEISDPNGVAYDSESKNIFVVDQKSKSVLVFTYAGQLVCRIDSQADPLKWPAGISVTDYGHILVVDSGNCCVKKYRYK